MTCNSVAEIFDDIDSTRADLLRSVEGLSAEQRDFRPSPDRWSVAEIVEHLSIVEGNVVRLLGTLMEKAGGEGAARVEHADGARIRFPHPVWGPINLYQWLLFVGAHEQRHLAQINALKETMNAER